MNKTGNKFIGVITHNIETLVFYVVKIEYYLRKDGNKKDSFVHGS